MRNSWKVAKWEVKRNMTNKSFIISLFLTPAIFILFFAIGYFFSSSNGDDKLTLYVNDELGVWEEVTPFINEEEVTWSSDYPFSNEEEMLDELAESENTAFISITDNALATGQLTIHLSPDLNEQVIYHISALEIPLRKLQLEQLGLTTEEAEMAAHGVSIVPHFAESEEGSGGLFSQSKEDILKRVVPGIFSGVILFSIIITGMMIFQSASQEKKEKVAEMILSSVTPGELMQGKIIGYFILGLIQVGIWIGIALPFIIWRFDLPLFEYLLVPELALLLFIAIAGYLMFASIFVSIGATVEDMTTASNFQGIVFMLPWVPFILFGPIVSDPSGIVAQVGSYIPITAPGVLLIRLSIMPEWPWLQIIIAIVILLFSIWLFMKLAGKIFKTGILMYGKNATPKEIWRWMRY